MRRKLREIKQQLRQGMHDPVRQTGEWLRSVVQGYFNDYAVPRNVCSPSLFRDRLLGLCWHTLCRRSQQRLSWKKIVLSETSICVRRWELSFCHNSLCRCSFFLRHSLPLCLRSCVRRAALELENLALRQQIGVLQRSASKRPKLTPLYRVSWAWLSGI